MCGREEVEYVLYYKNVCVGGVREREREKSVYVCVREREEERGENYYRKIALKDSLDSVEEIEFVTDFTYYEYKFLPLFSQKKFFKPVSRARKAWTAV